jgi:hypothetical protein
MAVKREDFSTVSRALGEFTEAQTPSGRTVTVLRL